MGMGIDTHCGAIPNRSAVIRRDMTPPKKDILSRVRTTLADCHEAVNDAMRFETYHHTVHPFNITSLYHEVTVLTLSLKFLTSRSKFSERTSLDKSSPDGVRILKESILKAWSALNLRRSPCFCKLRCKRSMWESKYVSNVSVIMSDRRKLGIIEDNCIPSKVNAPAHSEVSSRAKRSNGTVK